jgi:hypothetical protein
MNKADAVRIVTETFENPFDEKQFHLFIKELFNEIDESKNFEYHGNYIPDAFKDHIKQYKRLGQYTDPENNELDIITINLKKETGLERARTMQRNFAAWYLKNRGEKDAAVVAYYTEGLDDWRFSFVRMDYKAEKSDSGKYKVITDLSPARRYSFLVGKNEPNHTAKQQLAPLLEDTDNNPTIEQLEQSFNIESVTKEFYQKYRTLCINLTEHIIKEFKKEKLLKQGLSSKGIDEVSFSKKLMGQVVFLYFIQKKGWLGVPKNETWGKGDRRFLRTLLQKSITSKKNFYNDYLEFLFYEALATEHRGGSDPSYYPKFDCKIPFLNGGLFEADYDWKNTEIEIPTHFFTNKNKTEEGDEGDGILDVFDRYNFTVREDEPLEKEVAVDPEMLGKVFENLLEVKDRKSKGAYYTPREIVHYMCQESLINYLDLTLNSQPASFVKLGEEQTDAFGNKAKKGQLDLEAEADNFIKTPRKDLEEFIHRGITAIENDIRVEAKRKETDTYSYQLPQSIREHAKELDKALEIIRICDPAIGSGAFPVGMMTEIVKARQVLDIYLKKGLTAYDCKRHCIQESIYGVDIDHSAIDIAKLRLWLSLVVDEEDFYKIKPLPNLDYKIVEGNSLIGLPEDVFPDLKTETEIEKLKIKFFEETDNEEKKELRKQINKKIRRLLDSAEEFTSYHVDFDFKLFFSEVFHEKRGFDLVIGNPPYGIVFDNSLKATYEGKYKTFRRNNDVFVAFYESVSNLLNKKGNLRLITPNTFLNGDYFKELRRFFTSNFILDEILDFKDSKVFQDPAVFVCVFSIKRISSVSFPYSARIKISNEDFSQVSINTFQIDAISDFPFKVRNLITSKIKAKTLIDSLDNLFFVKDVGFNYWSIGKGKKRDGNSIGDRILYSGTRKNKNDKPFLKGKDITKYNFKEASNFLRHNYYDYLKNDVDIFRYSADYLGVIPKIIYRQTSNKIIATIDYAGNLCDKTVHIIVQKPLGRSIDLKYLLSLLNSSLFNYLYQDISQESEGRTFAQVKTVYIKQLPIQIIDKNNQKPFITLVDKILLAKKKNPASDTTELEREIDQLVYKLYGLTKEEIKTVENSSRKAQGKDTTL